MLYFIIAIIAFFYLIPTAVVSAISIDGDLTTMAWMRQEPITINGVDSSVPIYEYLRTSITNENDSLSAYVYGRIKKDVKNGENPDWRLFSGYLKWSGSDDSSVSIGRQFLPYNPGFWDMDGIKAKFKGFSIYAGSTVSSWSTNTKRGMVTGMELNLPEIQQLKSGLNLFANFNSKSFDRLILGGHLDSYDYSIFELRKFVMYSKINYDVLNKELIQGDININLNPLEKLGLYAEYHHEKQIFPEESIFSVFTNDDDKAASFGLTYNLVESISLGGKYERHFSSSFPSNTYEIGLNRYLIYGTTFGVNVLGTTKSNTESRNNGFSINIGRDITKKLSAGVGAYYNDYRLRKDQSLNRVSSIQMDLGYRVVNRVSANLRLEDNIKRTGGSSFRLLAMVKLGFGSGKSLFGRDYENN